LPPVVRDKTGKWISGGCFGFSFQLPGAPSTLPSQQFADDKYRRPEPLPFPTTPDPNKKQGSPDWTTKFLPYNNNKDACFYPKVPGTDCRLP
jgi:hypothetical protein